MTLLAALLAMAAVWLVVPGRRGRARTRGPTWTKSSFRWLRPTASQPAADPFAWDLIAGCLAAGLPLLQVADVVAASVSGDVGASLGRVRSRIDVGFSEEMAWSLAEGELGQVACDVGRSNRTGTGLVELMLTHADRVRDDENAARLTAARRLGVLAVLPTTLCFLPAFVLVGVVPVVAGAVLAFFT